ncbi:hypothetical protein QBC39DRAFT_30263 [Podospora conica]|nr:hypothetical protein QBC39DRAFT_30263 [Schizothecium conicum]
MLTLDIGRLTQGAASGEELTGGVVLKTRDGPWAFLHLNQSRAPQQASSNHGDRRETRSTRARRVPTHYGPPALSRPASDFIGWMKMAFVSRSSSLPDASQMDTCSSLWSFALGLCSGVGANPDPSWPAPCKHTHTLLLSSSHRITPQAVTEGRCDLGAKGCCIGTGHVTALHRGSCGQADTPLPSPDDDVGQMKECSVEISLERQRPHLPISPSPFTSRHSWGGGGGGEMMLF